MRRIFVGDIQGCLEQLEHLLDEVKFGKGDVLHPVGDLVNKGPDSEGVLRLLMELDAEPVLGNHDLKWLETGKIESRKRREWLRSQPIARILTDVDVIQVHAGIHPCWKEKDLKTLSRKQIAFAVTVRYCDDMGNRPPMDWPPPELPYRPWYEFYTGDKTVAFGHWARQGLYMGHNVVGLDSGCVYGGKLTAWIPGEDLIVQVPGWEGAG